MFGISPFFFSLFGKKITIFRLFLPFVFEFIVFFFLFFSFFLFTPLKLLLYHGLHWLNRK
ncbi:hypothetical protein BDZ91DRAFT_748214 [Kalaharituber pfeilii]|nr:hypothetical protein BDZ91DRAFT_748214 [Kalaharituber pfeilii]